MGFFDRFKSQPNPPTDKAERLFSMAHITAVSSLTTVLDRFDSPRFRNALKEHGTEPWDFFVTAACVFVAMSALDDSVSDKEADSIARLAFNPQRSGSDKVPDAMAEQYDRFFRGWKANGERAIEDCSNFVRERVEGVTGKEAAATLALSIGTWVLWNLYKEAPQSSDAELAGSIGLLATHGFASFWK